MSRSQTEIFRDANYLAYSLGPIVHPCTIIGLSSRGDPYDPIVPLDFNRPFFPDFVLDWGITANFICFVPSRNCWYLPPEVEQAMAAIKAATAHTRVITYGSSMGGYAAVNLASGLAADYFFALSPLCTIFDPFMSKIKDFRFKEDRQILPAARDGIARGDHATRRGLIVFDDKHDHDTHHAQVILSNTRAEAIKVSHSDHPSTASLNRIYSLRKILDAIVHQSLDVSAVQSAVDQVLPDLPETLASDLATFDRFLEMIDQSPNNVSYEGYAAASRTLSKCVNLEPLPKSLIDKVAVAAVQAEVWAKAPTVFIETIWRFCLAYKRLDFWEDAQAFATTHLPDKESAAFLARQSIKD